MTSAVAVRTACTTDVFAETSDLLAELRPGYPKFYSLADLSTQSRRRWVALDGTAAQERVEYMFRRYFAESGDRRYATVQVADAFAHGVVGRVVASFVLHGRVWDTGAENLAVRTDIDGGLDWAGVRDTTLRVLPTDPVAGAAGTSVLPCEEAVAYWLTCRSRHTLEPLFAGLARVSRCDVDTLWSTVGECVLGAATLVPTFAGTSPEIGHRRGQQVLEAMTYAGLPVRRRGGLPRTPGTGPLPTLDRAVC